MPRDDMVNQLRDIERAERYFDPGLELDRASEDPLEELDGRERYEARRARATRGRVFDPYRSL